MNLMAWTPTNHCIVKIAISSLLH